MKKFLLTILAAVALSAAVTSCEGYKDKDLEDLVGYTELQNTSVAVGATKSLGAGEWQSDDINVATIDNAGTLKGVAPGQCYVINTASNPRAIYLVTVE